MIPYICHLVLMIMIDLVMMASFSHYLMLWNHPDHTYFKYQKCRGCIYQNKSQFIATRFFHGKKLPSSDISYAFTSRPFTSNTEPSPCTTIKVKTPKTLKRCQCLIHGSPEDMANQVLQLYHRVQLSHCKMSTVK
jgi:hypothetical protein